MKKILGLLVIVIISATFLLQADSQVMIPNGNSGISSPTPVQAIVVDSQGNVSEQEYTYDPNTQVIVINSNNSGDNASLFFPLFAMGFIWWEGYWVNHDGNYWVDNHWVHVNNVNWDKHWNNYWHNHWNNRWHNYWNQHRNDPNFRYRNNEHWDDRSFRGGRNEEVQRGSRGGGRR